MSEVLKHTRRNIYHIEEEWSHGVFCLLKDWEEGNIRRIYERKKNLISEAETSNHALFLCVTHGIPTHNDCIFYYCPLGAFLGVMEILSLSHIEIG